MRWNAESSYINLNDIYIVSQERLSLLRLLRWDAHEIVQALKTIIIIYTFLHRKTSKAENFLSLAVKYDS